MSSPSLAAEAIQAQPHVEIPQYTRVFTSKSDFIQAIEETAKKSLSTYEREALMSLSASTIEMTEEAWTAFIAELDVAQGQEDRIDLIKDVLRAQRLTLKQEIDSMRGEYRFESIRDLGKALKEATQILWCDELPKHLDGVDFQVAMPLVISRSQFDAMVQTLKNTSSDTDKRAGIRKILLDAQKPVAPEIVSMAQKPALQERVTMLRTRVEKLNHGEALKKEISEDLAGLEKILVENHSATVNEVQQAVDVVEARIAFLENNVEPVKALESITAAWNDSITLEQLQSGLDTLERMPDEMSKILYGKILLERIESRGLAVRLGKDWIEVVKVTPNAIDAEKAMIEQAVKNQLSPTTLRSVLIGRTSQVSEAQKLGETGKPQSTEEYAHYLLDSYGIQHAGIDPAGLMKEVETNAKISLQDKSFLISYLSGGIAGNTVITPTLTAAIDVNNATDTLLLQAQQLAQKHSVDSTKKTAPERGGAVVMDDAYWKARGDEMIKHPVSTTLRVTYDLINNCPSPLGKLVLVIGMLWGLKKLLFDVGGGNGWKWLGGGLFAHALITAGVSSAGMKFLGLGNEGDSAEKPAESSDVQKALDPSEQNLTDRFHTKLDPAAKEKFKTLNGGEKEPDYAKYLAFIHSDTFKQRKISTLITSDEKWVIQDSSIFALNHPDLDATISLDGLNPRVLKHILILYVRWDMNIARVNPNEKFGQKEQDAFLWAYSDIKSVDGPGANTSMNFIQLSAILASR